MKNNIIGKKTNIVFLAIEDENQVAVFNEKGIFERMFCPKKETINIKETGIKRGDTIVCLATKKKRKDCGKRVISHFLRKIDREQLDLIDLLESN